MLKFILKDSMYNWHIEKRCKSAHEVQVKINTNRSIKRVLM